MANPILEHLNAKAETLTTTRAFREAIKMAVGQCRSAGRKRQTFFSPQMPGTIAPEMSLCYELGKKGNGSEVNAIIASMLRLGIRDFRNSFESADAAVSGPNRELWALRKTGWLSQGQIAEANRSIEKLMHIMDVPEPNGRLYAVSIVLTPLSRRSDQSDEPTVSF